MKECRNVSHWSTTGTVDYWRMKNESLPRWISLHDMKDMRREGGKLCSLPVRESQLLQLGDFGVSLRFCLESETATVSFICFIKFRLYLSLFAFLLVLGVRLSVLCFTEPGVYLPEFAFHCLWTMFALSSVSFSLDFMGPGLFHSIWTMFVLLSRAWECGWMWLATA